MDTDIGLSGEQARTVKSRCQSPICCQVEFDTFAIFPPLALCPAGRVPHAGIAALPRSGRLRRAAPPASAACGPDRRDRRFPAPQAGRFRRSSKERCGTADRLLESSFPGHDRPLLDDTFLKPAARGFGGLAFGQVGEQKHEADGPVQRGEHRVGTNQKRRHCIVRHRRQGPRRATLAGSPPDLQDDVRSRPDWRTAAAARRPIAAGAVGFGSNAATAAFSFRILPAASAMITGWCRLFHLPAHLAELILGQQYAHRPKLDDHVANGVAYQPRGGDVGVAPWIGGSLDDLVPLGKRATWRQGRGIVADQDRLERVAAPGHGANAFRAQPDEVFAGRG